MNNEKMHEEKQKMDGKDNSHKREREREIKIKIEKDRERERDIYQHFTERENAFFIYPF